MSELSRRTSVESAPRCMQQWRPIRYHIKSTSGHRQYADAAQVSQRQPRSSRTHESSFKALQSKLFTNLITKCNETRSSHEQEPGPKISHLRTTSREEILRHHGRVENYKLTLTACLIALIVFGIFFGAINCIVVYQLKAVSLATGRTDYVLAGESVELSCQYTMKDEAEDVKNVIWSKDGKNFLRWKKNRPGLEVLSYTFKGHIDQASSFQRLTINNVSTAMHGRYACSIRTDLGTHSGEHDLVVVSSRHCRLNDWRIHSEQNKCREMFRLDCRSMFPKPVPSCGLWDDKQSKFIRSVTVDISEELGGQHQNPPASGNQLNLSSNTSNSRESYRIRYSDKYVMKFANGTTNPHYSDLLEYAGRLVFKCDILIPETRWNVSLSHKMFDFQDGCNQDPLEAIERMRANYSQYAAQRLQQATHSSFRLQQQTELDIEMLATSLKYEIIPPSHLISADKSLLADKASSPTLGIMHNADLANLLTRSQLNQTKRPLDLNLDLNCFQRPRIGSFARLSCVSRNKNQQVKLVGASLLECRPNGWVPVRSSQTNLGEPTVIRKQQVQRKLTAMAASKRPTRAERPDGQILVPVSINPNRVEGASLNEGDENDDDDDSARTGSSDDINATSHGTTNNNKPIKSAESEDKVVFENEIKSQLSPVQDQFTPAELAALLPACISIVPAKSRKTHKLPMIEASRGDGRAKEPKVEDEDSWKWYIFTGSRASSVTDQQPFSIITLLVCIALLHQALTFQVRFMV